MPPGGQGRSPCGHGHRVGAEGVVGSQPLQSSLKSPLRLARGGTHFPAEGHGDMHSSRRRPFRITIFTVRLRDCQTVHSPDARAGPDPGISWASTSPRSGLREQLLSLAHRLQLPGPRLGPPLRVTEGGDPPEAGPGPHTRLWFPPTCLIDTKAESALLTSPLHLLSRTPAVPRLPQIPFPQELGAQAAWLLVLGEESKLNWSLSDHPPQDQPQQGAGEGRHCSPAGGGGLC